MKIHVDRGRCTGIGMCESIAPDFFEVEDDGRLTLHRETTDEDTAEAVAEAVRACPALALTLVDE